MHKQNALPKWSTSMAKVKHVANALKAPHNSANHSASHNALIVSFSAPSNRHFVSSQYNTSTLPLQPFTWGNYHPNGHSIKRSFPIISRCKHPVIKQQSIKRSFTVDHIFYKGIKVIVCRQHIPHVNRQKTIMISGLYRSHEQSLG